MQDHNVFGPEGTWTGGREKAPAAICRKVAEASKIIIMRLKSGGMESKQDLFYILMNVLKQQEH